MRRSEQSAAQIQAAHAHAQADERMSCAAERAPLASSDDTPGLEPQSAKGNAADTRRLEEAEAPSPLQTPQSRPQQPSDAASATMATKDIQEMFDVFDDDRGEAIDSSEFAYTLNSVLGFSIEQAELDGLFESVDTSGNGYVDREEWATLMRGILHKLEKKPLMPDDVRRALEATLLADDHRGAGRVSLAAIQPGFAKVGVQLDIQQAQGVMLSALGLGRDPANRAHDATDGPLLDDICEALTSLLRVDNVQTSTRSTVEVRDAEDMNRKTNSLALFGARVLALDMDDVDVEVDLGPLLQMVPLFANLDDAKFSRLTEICQRSEVRYKKGDAIVKQGEVGHELFLLLSGTAYAAVYSDESGGKKPTILKNYSRGDYFGEMALLNDDGKRAANVFVSSSDALCCTISRQDFRDLVDGTDSHTATEATHTNASFGSKNKEHHGQQLQSWRQQVSDMDAIENWRTLVRRFLWLDMLHNTIDEHQTLQGRKKKNTYAEADIREAISTRCFFFEPDGPFISQWQLFQVLVLLVTAIIVPLRAGFDQIDTNNPTAWFLFDLVSDLYFWFDIVLNFRTAFFDERQNLQHSSRKVAWNYATDTHYFRQLVSEIRLDNSHAMCAGWFIVDFLSVIPASYILYIMEPSSLPWRVQEGQSGGSANALKLLKILRLFRLTKMLKLLKLKELLETHEDNELLARFIGSLTIVKLFIQLLYMCHFLACFFYLFGDISESGRPDGTIIHGWVYRQQWGSYGWAGRYLYSFFLSITDETSGLAATDMELLWSGMQHILYEAFLAYLTGVFAGEVISGNAAQQEYTAKMDQVKYFMHHYQLPYSLRKQINAFYVHLKETKTFFDEEAVLTEFPPAIRKNVIKHIHKTIVDKRLVKIHYPFLSRLPERLRYDLCRVLRPLCAAHGEVIYAEGDYGDEMYLMDHGQCVAYKWTGNTMEDHKRTLDERKKKMYAIGQLHEGKTLHVRGIGGPTPDQGVYEDAQALRAIFEAYGRFDDAVIRHRVDAQTRKNTSYALVTMRDEESAQRVLEAAETVGILRPDGEKLDVTPYSSDTAKTSTGAMRRTAEAVEMMGSRVEDAISEEIDDQMSVGKQYSKYGERVEEYNDGSFFGEEALLGENIKRIATIVAVGNTSHIWYLDRAACSSFSRQEDVHLFNKELRSFARKRQQQNEFRARRMAQLDLRMAILKKNFSIAQMLAGGGLPDGARIPTPEELPQMDAVFSSLTLQDVREAVKFRCVALDFNKGDAVHSVLSAGNSTDVNALESGVFVLVSGNLKASKVPASNAASVLATARNTNMAGVVNDDSHVVDSKSEKLRGAQQDKPFRADQISIHPGFVFSGSASVKKVKKYDPSETKQASVLLPHPKGLHVSEVVVASKRATMLWLDNRLFDFAHDPNSLEGTLGEDDYVDDIGSDDEPNDAQRGKLSSNDAGTHASMLKDDLIKVQTQMSELKHSVDEKLLSLEQANASMQRELSSQLDVLVKAVETLSPPREPPRSHQNDDSEPSSDDDFLAAMKLEQAGSHRHKPATSRD